MRRKGAVLLLGFMVVVIGWWILRSGSLAQPEEGVLDVWATWADAAGQLQALFDRYSEASGLPVKVTAGVDSDQVAKAMAGSTPPDVVLLSGSDLVGSYYERGLVEPLDPWIKATSIDVDDIYPAPLALCEIQDGMHLCLPWGCDIDALFWNKDLFKAAGLDPELPPQTMEELVEYANRLTIRGEQGELAQVGFIPDFPRSHADLYIRMFGGAFYSDKVAELTVNSQPVLDALNWQRQFYSSHAPEDLEDFVSSFTPYMTSHHPLYAGRRLSCQQCHRSSPMHNRKMPDTGFYEGRIAMMIDGAWQVSPNARSGEKPEVNYGVAPFPPPSAHPERANTAVVQGPVVIVPAGATDKEAAALLLAWMMSPEILAEAAYASAVLPTSRTAAQDPRFQQMPNFSLFADLMAHPNTQPAVTTPISSELNEALGQVEEKLLREGGDPAPLLDKVQAEFAPRVKEALSYRDRP